MAAPSLVLLFTCLFFYVCDSRSVPADQESRLGVGGSVLFHRYRFEEASALASRLVSTMMDFRVELGTAAYAIVYEETTPDREARKEPCFRSLFGLPWYREIKPRLIAHLQGVLINLIKMDEDLKEMYANCGPSDTGCNDRLKIQAVKEIESFGKMELNNEKRITNMYMSNIKIEMERCLNSMKSGVDSNS